MEEGDPTRLWENDCSATKKICSGFPYFGGMNECGKDHTIHRTFEANKMPATTHTLTLQGKLWSMDSWDGEKIHVIMTDSQGDVLAEHEYEGNQRDSTVQCEGSAGWDDGFITIDLSGEYDRSDGDVTVTITNTLDETPDNESLGYGELQLIMDFDDGQQPNIGNPD